MQNPLFTNVMATVIKGINRIIGFFAGGNKRPVFFDIHKDYPELAVIQENYPVIREELENLLQQNLNIPRFHEIDSAQRYLSVDLPNKNWRMFELYCYGQKPEANRKLCPKTCAVIDKIPSIQHAVFSILESGKSIPPHEGIYMGILRYHLALIVPTDDPPQLKIKDQTYHWKEGESVLFDDTWIHSVHNRSKQVRVVLFIDVKRKLPFPINLFNTLLLKTLGSRYGKSVMHNLNWRK